jgi:hypothetical protein
MIFQWRGNGGGTEMVTGTINGYGMTTINVGYSDGETRHYKNTGVDGGGTLTIKTPKNSVVFLAPANNTSFITIDGNTVRVDDGSTAPLEGQSAVFVTGDFSVMAM